MRALALPPFLRLLLRWWWLCAWALGSVAAQAATYSNASIPFNWINPATHTKVGYNTAPYKFNGGNGCATTPPTLDDAISDQIPIGFNFTYGSTVYTQVQVMTNGRLQFNNSTCGFGTSGLGPPQTYPYLYPDGAMNNTMKVFGVDLDPTNLVDVPNYPASNNKTSCTSSAACFVSVATVGTAPNRKFVVTWYHVPEWVSASNSSGSFDVQVILNENGSFVYQYGTVVHGGTGTAQIGWQLTTGDYQVLTFGASAEPPANSAIVFFIPAAVLGWYQMEEGGWATGTSGQVRDSSGSGLGGTALGAAQPVAGGKVCRGVNIPLDTTAAGVNAVQLGASFDGTGAQTLAGVGTLMFWIKTNTAWSGAGVRTAQLVDATTVNGDWFTLTRQTDGSLVFLVTDSNGAQYSVSTGAQAIAAGTWVHVTVWWNFNGNPGSNQDSLAISLNAGNPVTSTFTSDGSLPDSLGNLVVGDNPSGIVGPGGSVN
jgi:hypothetical protein